MHRGLPFAQGGRSRFQGVRGRCGWYGRPISRTAHLHWKQLGAKLPRRHGLAAFDFDAATVVLTEASSRRRARLYVVHVHDVN
jgi:hypothetical protein